MKKLALTASAVMLLSGPASADALFSFGLNLALGGGGGFGATAGLWSTDQTDSIAGGLTGTYYLDTGLSGIGANVGYVSDGWVGSFGYDFLRAEPTVGLNIANTDDD
ncbi:hypothetical protein RM543_07095 [Roseicyclus sp. F158]|uniref:Outer membrane protein beta-barrel domain-containing protein n=1 Tax=Tropicimonas omnivorans TaxID=3075590 RepID=A0ABU3DFE6_9RHOB|nr:hypothetical protein [Roseicyclus sp. F158]MDT0682443.1 hypothetical protein [Roseicyclus sp. F158]